MGSRGAISSAANGRVPGTEDTGGSSLTDGRAIVPGGPPSSPEPRTKTGGGRSRCAKISRLVTFSGMASTASKAPRTAGAPQPAPLVFPDSPYRLHQAFEPAGDQPEAIEKLTA